VAGQVRQGYVHATGDATSFLPQPLLEAVALGPAGISCGSAPATCPAAWS
jgi:hypothetical protein